MKATRREKRRRNIELHRASRLATASTPAEWAGAEWDGVRATIRGLPEAQQESAWQQAVAVLKNLRKTVGGDRR